MSRTIRFKLKGAEAKYVDDTLNVMRGAGLLKAPTTEFDKSRLMEACAGIRQRITEAREQAAEEARAQAEGDTSDGDTGVRSDTGEGTGGEQEGTVDSSEEVE